MRERQSKLASLGDALGRGGLFRPDCTSCVARSVTVDLGGR